MQEIDLLFYKQWYADKVKDALTLEQKKEVLQQISDISLEIPIHSPNIDISKDKVPLLSNLTLLTKYSGRQLMAVMMEIAKELGLR